MNILVTGGCSFSECISPWIDTWPKHLSREMPSYNHISTAMGSQGNGLISRKIIYQSSELLKTTDAKDILVGIMWSGPDRHDLYLDYTKSVNFDSPGYGNEYMENPTTVVSGGGDWAILNHSWTNNYSLAYYGMLHYFIGSCIYTLEHILRTQWFLKQHNIQYFMTTYTSEVFPWHVRTHIDTKHLYDQIDMSKFLPVSGEYEWCRDVSGLDFPVPNDNHPSSAQHKLFTEKVILPFLETLK